MTIKAGSTYIQKEDLPAASFAPDARLYAGDGWLALAREAMAVIGSSLIHAIREDAGLLRIELGRPTPEQCETIREIQTRSAHVCEICGEPGSLRFEGLKNGQPAGWHRTRCDLHTDTRTMSVINATTNLSHREKRRREALSNIGCWLIDVSLRDAALRELQEIQELDRTSPLGGAAAMSLDELRESVPIHTDARNSYPYVLEEEIPEPWRERFLIVSVGSTRSGRGWYAHDWQEFLFLWQKEHLYLADRLLDLDAEKP